MSIGNIIYFAIVTILHYSINRHYALFDLLPPFPPVAVVCCKYVIRTIRFRINVDLSSGKCACILFSLLYYLSAQVYCAGKVSG